MTNANQPKKPRLIFATKALQQRPFQLGGVAFTSKRLTAEEDLLYENSKLQLNFAKTVEDLEGSLDIIARILNCRTEQANITREWVAEHINPALEQLLMPYLRTGHNGPGLELHAETRFDLPVLEAPLEIDGIEFAGPTLSYREQFEFARLVPLDLVEDLSALQNAQMSGGLREMGARMMTQVNASVRGKADVLAAALNARRVGEGEAVTGQWLLEHLTKDDLEAIENYLRTGAQEGETPNASTPANLPING